MPHPVTSRSCPTCGHDHGSPRDFMVAEVPVVEVTALEDLRKAIATIPPATALPPNLSELLEGVSKAGAHMETVAKRWETQMDTEAQGHSVPTPEDIEHYRTCPDCAPGWQKIWDGIATEARKGYTPNKEVKGVVSEVARQLTGAKGRA